MCIRDRYVIYTAHGLHFYKGAPILNWILFYPVEKLLARWTDTLITINKEDYCCVKDRFKLKKNGTVEQIHGVGAVSYTHLDVYKRQANM